MQFTLLLVVLLISVTHAFVGLANPARASTRMTMMEKTYIMVKPDGVQRGVVGGRDYV